MYELRKLVKDILIRMYDAEHLNCFAQDFDTRFDVYQLTGFSKKIPVPRQIALDCLFRHFSKEEQLVDMVSLLFANDEHFLYESRVRIPNKEKIIRNLKAKNWIYDEVMRRFKRDQAVKQSADWGFMRDGEEYQLCFASVDIVGNSQIVQSNVRVDVENTYSRLRSYIYKHIENHNGRIWYWHGDGGLAVFHDYSGIGNSMLAMITILSHLPVFNLCENELNPDTDIRLRIGINYGSAVYSSDTSKITSTDLALAEEVEKHDASPNSIAVTNVVYQYLSQEIRRYLTLKKERGDIKIYQYQVI